MNEITKALNNLKTLSKSSKGLNIEGYIPELTSTITLLDSSSPSTEEQKSLSEFLRNRLQPLYAAHLPSTLHFSIAVLHFLHTEKVVPFLQNGDLGRAHLWEFSASSVISGILDYLERHGTKKTREIVASAVYPTICAFYFTNGPGLFSLYDGNILSNAYMLLGETLESPGGDVGNLRDHIGSRRLGRTISEVQSKIVPLKSRNEISEPNCRSGKEKRNQFLQAVFEEPTFKDSKRILQALEVIKRDWAVTASKIIRLLAESDNRFPQPFQIFRFQVESSSMSTSDPIFVDNKSFIASLDQDGSIDSLVIPFTTIVGVTVSALNGSETKVELLINKAPMLGNKPMSLPLQEAYSTSFSILKTSVNNFRKIIRDRKLRMEHPAHRKLSQTPSELLPEVVTTEDNEKWQAKAAKLTNMAKHGGSEPADQHELATLSPRVEDSTSDNNHDGSADQLPSTVFLDTDGNLSIHPPHAKGLNPTETANASYKHRQDSEDDEMLFRKALKPKTKAIILSDVEDDDSFNPDLVAFGKETDRAQLPKVLKMDDIPSETPDFPKEIVDIDSRKARNKFTDDVKDANKSKKRKVQNDALDAGASTTKRVRRDLNSAPPSPVAIPKQKATQYGRKSQHAPIASPTKENGNGFDVDFDEIPKSKQDRPQARAKAMKGKGGRAPKPRPIVAKKKKKQGGDRDPMQHKANVELEDADKTLVDRVEFHETNAKVRQPAKDINTPKISDNKYAKTRSKKSNMAPWEIHDFPSVKMEETEVTIGFDPMDDFPSKIERPSSDVVDDPEDHDLPRHEEATFEDRHVEFVAPLKAETTPSSEPPPLPPASAQPDQIWIDLTNSPIVVETTKSMPLKRAVRKSPSFDNRRHEFVEVLEVPPVPQDQLLYSKRIGKAHETVEKLTLLPVPLDEPESVSSTPPRARHARTIKVIKFSSPIRGRRSPLGDGKHMTAPKANQATGRPSAKEQGFRSRVTAKEKNGSSGSNKIPCESEMEDAPNSRIAAVLCEINRVLVGNIEKRFMGMSSDLERKKGELKTQVAGELGKMNNELVECYNNLVNLHGGYVSHTTKLANALEVFEKASAENVRGYQDMLKDFRRNSLRNKLPAKLVKKSTIDAIMKFSKLDIEI